MTNGDPKLNQEGEKSESNFFIKLLAYGLRNAITAYQGLANKISGFGNQEHVSIGLSEQDRRYLELRSKMVEGFLIRRGINRI
jgi:hypothetical protein